ncbi:MFS transporter [Streptomyces sp. NPDC007088]|uniref:MFS transporter n=1 Tax=Streptomyces sp. NPDC007088 TaxID=3364773 RepID=UPI00368F14CB
MPREEGRAGRRVLLVCLAAGATTLVDQSVLNIALPSLRDSLAAGPSGVQWIVAGYSLAFGLALVPGGSLGDVRGRKGLFVLGLSAFLAAALVAATAGAPGTVITARLVQGAGAGLVNSQVIGTLQDVFASEERSRALGRYAVVGGLAAGLGPPLGGALVAGFGPGAGWRLCLLLSAPCAVATLFLASRRLPPPRRTARHSGLDVGGLLLAGMLTLTLMLPFITTPDSLGGAASWAAAAAVSGAALGVQQRLRSRAKRPPLLHPALAASKPYLLGTAVAMAQFGSSMAASLVLTVFLQAGLGLSALATAAVALPSALAMGLSSAVAWRVVRRLGPRAVSLGLALGAGALVASAAVTLTVPVAALPVTLAAAQAVVGAASGLTVSPNQAQVLQHAPAEAAGLAGGVLQMAQRIAAAVCLSAVSGVYLRGAAHEEGVPRTAFALSMGVCAGLLLAGLVLSVSRRATVHRRPATSPRAPAPVPEETL